jgi:hypothetical protein
LVCEAELTSLLSSLQPLALFHFNQLSKKCVELDYVYEFLSRVVNQADKHKCYMYHTLRKLGRVQIEK